MDRHQQRRLIYIGDQYPPNTNLTKSKTSSGITDNKKIDSNNCGVKKAAKSKLMLANKALPPNNKNKQWKIKPYISSSSEDETQEFDEEKGKRLVKTILKREDSKLLNERKNTSSGSSSSTISTSSLTATSRYITDLSDEDEKTPPKQPLDENEAANLNFDNIMNFIQKAKQDKLPDLKRDWNSLEIHEETECYSPIVLKKKIPAYNPTVINKTVPVKSIYLQNSSCINKMPIQVTGQLSDTSIICIEDSPACESSLSKMIIQTGEFENDETYDGLNKQAESENSKKKKRDYFYEIVDEDWEIEAEIDKIM